MKIDVEESYDYMDLDLELCDFDRDAHIKFLLLGHIKSKEIVSIIMEMQAFQCKQCASTSEDYMEICDGFVYLDQIDKHFMFVAQNDSCMECRTYYTNENEKPLAHAAPLSYKPLSMLTDSKYTRNCEN